MTIKRTPGDGDGKKINWSELGTAVSRRLCFLDSNRLCANARQRTGVEDFGDPPVEPALSVLTESLEKEAKLRPLGRFLMRVHLRTLLETRLRLAAAWKPRTEVLQAEPINVRKL